MSGRQMVVILGVGGASVCAATIALGLRAPPQRRTAQELRRAREAWRTPRLEDVGPAKLTLPRRICLVMLRGYLVLAIGMIVMRIMQSINRLRAAHGDYRDWARRPSLACSRTK